MASVKVQHKKGDGITYDDKHPAPVKFRLDFAEMEKTYRLSLSWEYYVGPNHHRRQTELDNWLARIQIPHDWPCEENKFGK